MVMRPTGLRKPGSALQSPEPSVIHYTAMVDVEAGRFTVGVFQDVAWASKGVAALVQAGLPPASLTIVAQHTPEAAALLEKALGASGTRREIAGVGATILHGPMVDALQGSARDSAKAGIAGTMRRVGFQAHDARIFEALVGARRHPGRGPQRAAGCRRPGCHVLVRRRQRGDWGLDRTRLEIEVHGFSK